MNKKIFIWILGLAILLVSIISFIGFWYEESYDKIASAWAVKRIVINEQDVTKEFSSLFFVPGRGGGIHIILPIHKEKKFLKIFEKHEYEYYRTGLFEGNLRIFDKKQGIFSGDYQIEILNHNSPQLVKVFSDSIEFILSEQKLSLGNSIKVDFGE